MALLAACSDPGENVSSEVPIARPLSLSLSFSIILSESEDVLRPEIGKQEGKSIYEYSVSSRENGYRTA